MNKINPANKTSIVDVPKHAKDEDLFGINRYKNGLIRFIENADTPITIAIQGEWGSGKTSLMNSLEEELCGGISGQGDLKNHQHAFYSIWLNTWQYAMMKSDEEAIISIVTSLSAKILHIINTRHKSVPEKVWSSIVGWGNKIAKKAASTAASQVLGDTAGNVVDALMEKEEAQQTISQLRDQLQTVINNCLELDQKEQLSPAKKGFIFFIDDLDRIDPPVAVQILELLKNIFDLQHCIFVLAIDYDVVIKGLKPKFGDLNERNEREFRSFFDKIIQMPFSMPVASYSIGKFLIDNLTKINYFRDSNPNQAFAEKITLLCNLSVGANPRSLKRLLNTISLITIINNDDASENEDSKIDESSLLINFGLICIQVAYPLIYKSLCIQGDFKSWDEQFAMQMKLRTLEPHEVTKLSASAEFDEIWEQVLYRICEKDLHLSNRASQISQMLNVMAAAVSEGMNLGEVIEELLELSSITEIQAFDKPKLAIHKGDLLKKLSVSILPLLKYRLNKTPFPEVRKQGKKVQTNLFIAYSKETEGWKNWIGFSVNTQKDQFILTIWSHPWLFAVKTRNMMSDLQEEGLLEEYNKIAERYNQLETLYSAFKIKYPGLASSGIAKNWHVPHIDFEYRFFDPEEVFQEATLSKLADFITDFMILYGELIELGEQYNKKLPS